MLTLSLLRHAKSSWDDPGLSDHDRPLNVRGKSAAPRMGDYLRGLWESGERPPDLVLCSTAARTRETWQLVAARLATAPKVAYEQALYLAGAEGVAKRLRRVSATVRHVMVVGHNPDLHELALRLASTGDAKKLAALNTKLPTCGLVILTLEADDWRGAMGATGELIAFVTPKTLAGV